MYRTETLCHEAADADGFYDKLMENIIKVIEIINKIESEHETGRIECPSDRESMKQAYNKEIRRLNKSYREYRKLINRTKN